MKLRLFSHRFFWVFSLPLIFWISCQKNNPVFSLEALPSPVNTRIHKLTYLTKDTVFICGGAKNKSGFIYRSVNGGKNWTEVYRSDQKSLYDIFFLNDTTAFCTGDKLLLLRSRNNGAQWDEVIYDFIPEHFNYLPIRCIFGDEKLLMFAGGENYDNGAVMWMVNGQLKWVWHFDNEFRTGLPFSHLNYHLLGFGTGYKTTDMGFHYTPTSFKDDFITGSALINASTAFICGYDGGIYKTDDAGKSWQTMLKPNSLIKKRIHFNTILFKGNTGYAAGNNGLLMKSINGSDWKKVQVNTSSDILSMTENPEGNIILTTSSGEILILKI